MTTPQTARSYGNNTGNSSVEDAMEFVEYKVTRVIHLVFPVLAVTVSTFGNLMCIALMNRKSMRGSSAAVYLSGIAVADTLAVYFGVIPTWINAQFRVSVTEESEVACKALLFSLYLSSDAAVWLLLSITVDRFISVVFPYKARTYCTWKRAVLATIVVVLVASCKNLHLLFTRGAVHEDTATRRTLKTNCGFVSAYGHFGTYVRPWLGFTLYAFIPMTVMIVCNAAIIRSLMRMKNGHKTLPRSNTLENNVTSTSNAVDVSSSSKVTQRRLRIGSMTGMFLAISVAFVFLIGPCIVIYTLKPYWGTSSRDKAKLSLALAMTEILSYTNHSINFFLYCITGRRFRNEFMTMIKCRNSRVSPVTKTQSLSINNSPRY